MKIQKVLPNGGFDKRKILITIDAMHIAFYFAEQHYKRLNWIYEESERRVKDGIEELSEEDKEGDEFYWIFVDDWNNDRKDKRQGERGNWHSHMKVKNWFSEEMYDFIEKTLNNN